MTDTSLRRRIAAPDLVLLTELGLAALILVALGLKLHLVFILNINWDEFLYLSIVHVHQQGQLESQFQTFHVHLFAWLPWVADNEIDQILAARVVMYLLGWGSCILTYLIGRLFLERAAALFAVLCLLALHSVVEHGTSFRADPMGAFLMLGSVYALIRPPRRALVSALAGLAMALALAITIKSAIYLPMIGAIFLCQLRAGGFAADAIRNVVVFAVILLLATAAFHGFHILDLSAARLTESSAFMGGVASKVIVLDQFFPQWRFFLSELIDDFWIWGLLAFGVYEISNRLRRKPEKRSETDWMPLVFLIPLLSPLVYRNAFPYFYVFIMAPAIVFCGALVDRLVREAGATGSAKPLALAAIVTLPVMATFIDHYVQNKDDAITPQREIVELVHRLFPEPVAYIDRNATISSFPRPVFFMSTWGLENYQDRGVPIMRRVLTEHQPRFLIANSPVLALSRPRKDILAGYGHALLAEDFKVLGDNFVPHWGLLYVAGKRFALDVSGKPQEFEILIPGRYTLEGAAAATIDGATLRPGETVELTAGRHAILSNTTPAQVTLRWGDHLYRPPGEPSKRAFFARF